MFSHSQRYYDAVYSGKDYAREAHLLTSLIAEHKQSDGNMWLDVACGTGGHVPYLYPDFAYEGLDLDPEMLALARARFPHIVFHQGDMVSFSLDRRFDVVTCLFSSIAYVRTAQRLQQAIINLSRHLRPGGVLLIGAFFTPQQWMPGHPHAMFVDQPDLKLARMNVSGLEDGNIAVLDFHYLVATPDGVEHFSERHELGLFTDEEYRAAFSQASLDISYESDWIDGRGMYIGTNIQR